LNTNLSVAGCNEPHMKVNFLSTSSSGALATLPYRIKYRHNIPNTTANHGAVREPIEVPVRPMTPLNVWDNGRTIIPSFATLDICK